MTIKPAIVKRRRHSREGDQRFYAKITMDDMSPRFHLRESVIFNKSLKPVIGDDVMIILKSSTEGVGLVRRLVGFDGLNLRLLQYNPRVETETPMAGVAEIYPCVGFQCVRRSATK